MPAPIGRLIRQREVTLETGVPKSTIYYLIARGAFPKPLKLSARAVAWNFDEIQEWKNSRKVA